MIFKFFSVLTLFTSVSYASHWSANIKFVNFTDDEKEKVESTVKIIQKIILSDEFKKRVLDHRVDGEKKFIDNLGLSNEEIYEKIRAGAEIIGDRSVNHSMDVELELFHSEARTIGYTYPSTARIWINRRYFEKYTLSKVADNLVHEWMHKLGFDHAKSHDETREKSVPYAIGYLIEEIAEKM